METKTALITGASSGIGLALAQKFAQEGHDVVMVAENGPELEAAAKEVGAGGKVVTIVADLATREGPKRLWDEVGKRGLKIDYLANNAGVGVYGDFVRETDLDAEIAMIELNVIGVIAVTKLFAKDMVARGAGKILITSSMVAYTGSPMAAVYGATKAFDYYFAEALRAELQDTGVTVTALVPDATETNWFARAGAEDTEIAKTKKVDPMVVAEEGYKAMMAGTDHVVGAPLKSKLMATFLDVFPDEKAAEQATIK